MASNIGVVCGAPDVIDFMEGTRSFGEFCQKRLNALSDLVVWVSWLILDLNHIDHTAAHHCLILLCVIVGRLMGSLVKRSPHVRCVIEALALRNVFNKLDLDLDLQWVCAQKTEMNSPMLCLGRLW